MAVPRPRAKQNANKGGREFRVLHSYSSNACPQVSDSLRYKVYTVCAMCVCVCVCDILVFVVSEAQPNARSAKSCARSAPLVVVQYSIYTHSRTHRATI